MDITKKKLRLIILVSFFFIALPDIAIGQISYRATEDALKQLIKDIESVRKAPINSSINSKKDVDVGQVKSSGTYQIKKGDTLNQIINRNLSSSPISSEILKMSIVKSNRHAFKRNNPNWMYAGKIIKFPTVADLKKLLFKNRGNDKRLSTSNPDNWVQFP